MHVVVTESFQICSNRKQICQISSQYHSQPSTILHAIDDSTTPIVDDKVSKVEVAPSNISKPVVKVGSPVIRKNTVSSKVVVSDAEIQLKYATLIGK